MLLPDLSARRAHRHIAFLLSFAAFGIPGCEEKAPVGRDAALTIGAEGFEPPVVRVTADAPVELTLSNETAREQTVVVGDVELAVPAGGAGGADLGVLREGRHEVTLEGTPFEATLVAEDGDER
jgi:hypothetical protein